MKLIRDEWSVVTVAFVFFVMLLALTFPAEAQRSEKVPRIGFLSPVASEPAPRIEAFRQGLRERGYIEGQNIVIEYRFAEGKPDRLPILATELARLKVDVIVVVSTTGAQAAKDATKVIPVVMATSGDPVGSGLVSSLARPGGNITGLTLVSPELSGKRLELLKEAFAKISKVAVLLNPGNTASLVALKETEAAAEALRLRLQSFQIKGLNDLESAFSVMAKERTDALIALSDPLITFHRKRIVELTVKHRLPAMYASREVAEAGGLMSYGPHIPDLYWRAAYYVDKILKGAKPADLPVEQPTKFELVINLKTAKQIGLAIPPNVLARADKVIK
jgi:putative ABC transport system substrate-binding protein